MTDVGEVAQANARILEYLRKKAAPNNSPDALTSTYDTMWMERCGSIVRLQYGVKPGVYGGVRQYTVDEQSGAITETFLSD